MNLILSLILMRYIGHHVDAKKPNVLTSSCSFHEKFAPKIRLFGAGGGYQLMPLPY